MKSPFVFSKVVTGDYFVGSENEIKKLTNLIEQEADYFATLKIERDSFPASTVILLQVLHLLYISQFL